MDTLETDIAIIGAGIVGAATAYALKVGLKTDLRVLLVERDTSYRLCSTARSAGGIRQQFSTPENIHLSLATLDLVRNLKRHFGPDADVGFREHGYLVMASADGAATIRSNAAIQRAHGGDIHVADSTALAARFPWLATDGIAVGAYSTSGEGWADPSALMNLLRAAAITAGAELVRGDVTDLVTRADRVTHIRLADGQSIAATHVVNAAGAWSGAVARLAGAHIPVEPRKRYVYVVDCREATDDLRRAPLTVDPTGVWFRPEGRAFICGISPAEADEPPAEDLDQIDDAPFTDLVWPALAQRVPVFESLRMTGAWAGFYDYNTLDQNALIGRVPGFGNFYAATGFSGHGFQQAYAAGRAIAEEIVFGRQTSLDLSRFSVDRVARNEPVFELNII